MNSTLKKLKEVTSDCCVTIILQTHRTRPDNEKDPIVLKNLAKEAETRLIADYDRKLAAAIVVKINKLANTIDHSYNQESLILFVNENIAEFIRLPVQVHNRVVVDKTFATRDLVRALHRESAYYVLTLSRNKARLIEAFNDKVVSEIKDGFPMENTYLVPVQAGEAAIANRQTSLIVEFFNQVDKQLNAVHKVNPLQVIIATEESNYSEYLKVADRKEIIVAHLNGSRDEEKANHIVDAAWPIMKQFNSEKNHQRLSELAAALSSGHFITDFNEIWKAIEEGRSKTLFVKEGYFQPARLENNTIELISPASTKQANVDDIIDEMIEKSFSYGGDAVFISGEGLQKFQGLVLVTRY